MLGSPAREIWGAAVAALCAACGSPSTHTASQGTAAAAATDSVPRSDAPAATATSAPRSGAAARDEWKPTSTDARVDVAFATVAGREPNAGRTGDLHASAPQSAYVILVHAPAPSDARFQMQSSTLDVLFHPHDPAPGVLYVASFSDERLDHATGRWTHQVDAASAAVLQEHFGDFAALVLDARGEIRLHAPEPATREALQRAVGHRDRKPPPPRPRPRLR